MSSRLKMEYKLQRGEGRTRVILRAVEMGQDLLVRIFNEGVHIGAVAIGEFDREHQRASVSVVTRLGHKDDALAQKAAYAISKYTQKTVCVVAGVHLDNITEEEIGQILKNSFRLIQALLKKY
ncbi:MAG: hypothetical protein H6Q39_1378 [Chloroflexi bacterium]|nr:hypothetical protein [Chloroflexota bacterium]